MRINRNVTVHVVYAELYLYTPGVLLRQAINPQYRSFAYYIWVYMVEQTLIFDVKNLVALKRHAATGAVTICPWTPQIRHYARRPLHIAYSIIPYL